MRKLQLHELQTLRLAIFKNAESLHDEAEVLLLHGKISRAYLLAHFCCEELGKIPIVVGVIAQLQRSESVDWRSVRRRFTSHEEKIASQNGHYYAFGLDNDLLGNADVEWLVAANKAVSESYQKKNLATYVDVLNGIVVCPSESIGNEEATKLVAYARACLQAHRRSESLTNPLLYEVESELPNNHA